MSYGDEEENKIKTSLRTRKDPFTSHSGVKNNLKCDFMCEGPDAKGLEPLPAPSADLL